MDIKTPEQQAAIEELAKTVDPKEFAKRSMKKGKKFASHIPGGKLGKVMAAAGAVSGITHFVRSDEKDLKTVGESALMVGLPLLSPLTAVAAAGLTGGGEIGKALKKAVDIGIERDRLYQKTGTASPFASSKFIETKDTYTMRQAGMAAIGQARGDIENSMMGNEAQFLK